MASRHGIVVGGVPIGGGAPVAVQSMTTTNTRDLAATLGQIAHLDEAGCELVRVAVPGRAVEERLAAYPEVFEVAVMGCAVNGPGEASSADFGIAAGRDSGFIYAHGAVLRKVAQSALVDELFAEIDGWIAGGMARPARDQPRTVQASG